MFDAAFQLRVLLDPTHPMARASHPRALELLNRSDTEQDSAVRAALLREVQSIAHEQALTVPLYQVVDLYGVREQVVDFVPSADTILRLGGVGFKR
jgi:ABC-type transport system substrate-binding protein